MDNLYISHRSIVCNPKATTNPPFSSLQTASSTSTSTHYRITWSRCCGTCARRRACYDGTALCMPWWHRRWLWAANRNPR